MKSGNSEVQAAMKAVLEDMRSGKVMAYEVPQPELRPGGILVRTAFSAISSGTERAKLEAGEKSLMGKAMARPDWCARYGLCSQ